MKSLFSIACSTLFVGIFAIVGFAFEANASSCECTGRLFRVKLIKDGVPVKNFLSKKSCEKAKARLCSGGNVNPGPTEPTPGPGPGPETEPAPGVQPGNDQIQDQIQDQTVEQPKED